VLIDDMDEDERLATTDRHGMELPAWVPHDHPLTGTHLRPIELSGARREPAMELWFPVLAMAPCPVALFVLWLRNPVNNPAAAATGTWCAIAVCALAVLLMLRHAGKPT
jgi:hypothetical protein